MDVIAEIRRRHFVGNEKIIVLAKAFGLSRPTIRKHLKTVEEPVYLRKHQPHPKLGSFHGQLDAWLKNEASLLAGLKKLVTISANLLQILLRVIALRS